MMAKLAAGSGLKSPATAGSKEMFEKRMRPGRKKIVQKEFDKFIKDMGYESLLGSTVMKTYLYEFFVGGWGAKTRHVVLKKRNEKELKDG